MEVWSGKKSMERVLIKSFLLLVGVMPATPVIAGEWRGLELGAQWRMFNHSDVSGRETSDLSFSVLPEYYHEWRQGDDSLTFIPYVRVDENDNERTHVDIRELNWEHAFNDWHLIAGIDVVYWGITESQQLVNIINQVDLVEDIDGDEKLGQPMIALNNTGAWGNIELYLLPGFRERTLPEREGRLGLSLKVDRDNTVYASSKEGRHIDIATRWSHYLGDLDFGVSLFSGTDRQPQFLLKTTKSFTTLEDLELVPFYDQMHQVGLDLQYISGSFLWKLEGVHRKPDNSDHYAAATAGLEYTQVGLLGSRTDLGWIAEYMYDARGAEAPIGIFERDIFLGLRWAQNDVYSSELLASLIYDPTSSEKVYSVEYATRLESTWKLEVVARVFSGGQVPDYSLTALLAPPDSDNKLGYLQDEDYISITLSKYF